MTFIEPNQHRFRIHIAFVIGVATLIGGALLSIYLYNETVHLRHLIERTEESIKELEVANAELRNDLYQRLDTVSLRREAISRGFIEESHPRYLEVASSDLARKSYEMAH